MTPVDPTPACFSYHNVGRGNRNKGEEAMSDHLDSPGPITVTKDGHSVMIGPPLGDAKTDITDLYAFLKPDAGGEDEQDDDAVTGKSILMLNVNPLAPALANEFESGAEYLIRVDTDSDAVEDINFRVTFSPKVGERQTGRVERINGAGGSVVISNAPVSFGAEAMVTVDGPYKLFAGL